MKYGEKICVVPIEDIKDHDDFNPECSCRPTIEIHEGTIVIIHNAWDARELTENICKN